MQRLFSVRYSFARTVFYRVYRGYLIPQAPRAPSAVALFRQQYNRGSPNKINQKQAFTRWNNLSKQQKDNYKQQVDSIHQKQTEQYQAKYISKLRPKISAYALYVKCQNFDELKKDNPGARPIDIFKKIAERWRMLPTEQRQRYKDTRGEPDLDSLKQHKIPKIKVSDHKPQAIDQRIHKNIQQIRQFCDRHNISIQQLYSLLKQSASKRAKGSKQKKSKKKQQESSSSSSETSDKEQ